jgi:magnesium-protoporphyrin O-methyltransferase
MSVGTYADRRQWLSEYFDRTAAAAWADLTSDAPVSWIRRTVRAGRDQMRERLLSWLPDDLRGQRILDAGCGTGTLSIALARRGAKVVGIDVAPAMIRVARQRAPADRRIVFRVGDMLDPGRGNFDVVIAMDSLIHYDVADAIRALVEFGYRTDRMIVTFPPRTMLLSVMHAVGRRFPRADRAPAIRPVSERALRSAPSLLSWPIARTARISRGFYTSQAYDLQRGV